MYIFISIEQVSKHTQFLSRTTCSNLIVLSLDKSYLPLQASRLRKTARSMLDVRKPYLSLHTVNK